MIMVVRDGLQKPVNGFHIVDFMPGDGQVTGPVTVGLDASGVLQFDVFV
jgi:hypothetical protein